MPYTKIKECKSEYFAKQSKMENLCPECSHVLFGYPNCTHIFENTRYIKCYWNGKTSEFLKSIKQ